MAQLSNVLDSHTIPASLVEEGDDGSVRCTACAHRCLIRAKKRGICGVRFNRDGQLLAPWGYTAGMAVDPIEKKPFSHLLPSADVLTFGMLGCNFHCDFCQNWLSSQVLRDPDIQQSTGMAQKVTPEQVVALALQSGAQAIASSYNEPIITAEWAHDIFALARENGLKTAMVSNGYATRVALEYLRPVMDGYKIDLKSMQEKNYRSMGAVLKHVIDSIAVAHDMGYWVEVVTLVIPDFNDSPAELWDAARTIVSVSPDIPWHVTGYHPDYKMLDHDPTSARHLQQAADIGQEAGLHYVYAGNLPGRVGPLENTYCPNCCSMLIERRGYTVTQYSITEKGTCPKCGQAIAGVWTEKPSELHLHKPGIPWRVR
jgi:pyruvate formate lyase activating enzyme